jgi:hypothetical protein
VNSVLGRTVTITPTANPLQLKKLFFTPQNEAERATYIVSILPFTVIKPNYLISIKFPINYDPLIGTSVSCSSIGGILSEIMCSISDRELIISGLSDYTPNNDDPIMIQIVGIVNPNSVSIQKPFRIGLFEQYSVHFIDYNYNIPALNFLPAPSWTNLFNSSSSNLYIRKYSTYSFNFTTSKYIP